MILIAGINGIIGRHLNRSLDKYPIYGLSKGKQGHKKNFSKVDLESKNEVDNFIKDSVYFDTIIFLVALAHDKGKKSQLKKFKDVNIITLKNLMSSFRKYSKMPRKIIYSSTISVYGEKINTEYYYENLEKNPFTPYAITKLEAENFLLGNYPEKTWILRFAPVYSEKFTLNIDRRTKLLGCYYKVGGGEKKLSLLNIKNIDLTIKAILDDKIPSGVYNLSDKKE